MLKSSIKMTMPMAINQRCPCVALDVQESVHPG